MSKPADKLKSGFLAAKKVLLKGDDEMDAKLFEELKMNTADENLAGALKCIKCKKPYPEEYAAEFKGKCVDCAEKEFLANVTSVAKKAFAVIMVFLIVIAANYLLLRPILGEKIAPLAEHKIFGNIFKNQFIYYAFEAFSIVYIITSYFKQRGSREDQRVVTATAVMLSVGLLMMSLLFKTKGLTAVDFVLLGVLALLIGAVVFAYVADAKKIRAYKFATVELNAKIAKDEVEPPILDVKVDVEEIEEESICQNQVEEETSKKLFGGLETADGRAVVLDKKFVFDNYAEFSKDCDNALSGVEYPTFDDVAAGEAI